MEETCKILYKVHQVFSLTTDTCRILHVTAEAGCKKLLCSTNASQNKSVITSQTDCFFFFFYCPVLLFFFLASGKPQGESGCVETVRVKVQTFLIHQLYEQCPWTQQSVALQKYLLALNCILSPRHATNTATPSLHWWMTGCRGSSWLSPRVLSLSVRFAPPLISEKIPHLNLACSWR